MKKALSLILALVLLMSLCACSKRKPQSTNPSNFSQDTTGSTEESVKDTAESTQPTAENLPASPTPESTNAPTKPTEAPTSKPTEAPATKPTEAPVKPTTCSHSYKDATCTTPKTCTKCNATEGNALGHTWKDATCIAPKTCSKCNATEGSVGAHTFADGICTICKTIDKINPKTNLVICGDKSTEEYISKEYAPYDDTTVFAPGLSFYDDGGYGEGVYCLLLDAVFISSDELPVEDMQNRPPIIYNNEKYYRAGAGMSPAEVDLTDTEIIITTQEGNTIKLIMTSDGNLKVTASTKNTYPVGMVMSTQWSYLR